jgi:lipoprotein signal peptidase
MYLGTRAVFARLPALPCADPAALPFTAGRQDGTRQSAAVLALLAVAVVLDQAAKWWAWRHVPWARINSGGDVLVGRTIGVWYADPVTGALLDLLDFGLLSIAVSVLARCRATAAVRVPGALMTGGWVSNVLDRLGVHYWTAPGSVRGVVDFIHIGRFYYNVADFFIIGCTPLFLLAAGYQGVRAARRPAAARSAPPPARSRARAQARIPALVGAGLVLVVALGAANYGGVNAAPRTPTRKTTDMHLDRGCTAPCLLTDIQVSPRTARRAHAGLDGSFSLFEFPEPADLDVAYVGGQAGTVFIEKIDEVRRFVALRPPAGGRPAPSRRPVPTPSAW